MKKFPDENFLLCTKTAQQLYHEFAKEMPVIDYHNHLPAQQISDDICFENLTQAWLYGDHYKWRAMRTNGVDEYFCTGAANDYAKFEQWAATVPYTLRNPLYHWTHLELQRYFDINKILSPATSKQIYDACSEKLQSKEYSIRNLLRKMKVTTLCTTDDPTDLLEYHQQITADEFEIKVLPSFRPDKAMAVDDVTNFNTYINKLEAVTNVSINSFDAYFEALQQRHDFFATVGCVVSDHGIEQMITADCTYKEAQQIFSTIRSGNSLTHDEEIKFRWFMLLEFAKMNYAKGWVQQYHIGAIRNNNTRMMLQLGPDTGWDSIGNNINAKALSAFLDTLDADNMLAKTILYNLNPADNAMMATMVGNFNDGSAAGKIQWGSSWWFLDQKDGITEQINTLSNMGLLSKFVGMLTDSRSFLSYPRHEYFRRILCNLFGNEIENGELSNDIAWTGKIIQDICYTNAKQYFGF
ncbi:glucuronate isomerase [soil metagenome]